MINTQQSYLRDGIPIEKGVVLTKEFLDDNQELITKYLNYIKVLQRCVYICGLKDKILTVKTMLLVLILLIILN